LLLQFKAEGHDPAGLSQAEVDLLVLSNGLAGPAGATELAGLLGLAVREDGFLAAPGGWPLVVAGSAGGPMGLAEAVQDGRLAALRLLDGQGVGR
jgi:heterodisulfide reductase subunit A-like polyferredoxin